MEGGAPGGAAREVDELDEVGRLEEVAPGVEGVMGLLSDGTVDLRFRPELLEDDPEAALPFVVGVPAPPAAPALSLRFPLGRLSELELLSAAALWLLLGLWPLVR